MHRNLLVTIIIVLAILAIAFAIWSAFEPGVLKGAKALLVNLPTMLG